VLLESFERAGEVMGGGGASGGKGPEGKAFAGGKGGVAFTDEAMVVEAAGHEVHLVEGEVGNIKITLPADLLYAERMIQH
jgi:hypothetical protein